ncbi:MAG: J domain-containing protein [Desulforhabdus sp.]|nr:J domain-containing protein [Desulforhabdus sp.]
MTLKEEALIERAKLVLGIRSGADQREIKYAYYRCMFQHHPDRNPDNPEAHKLAALIGEAYRVLTGKSEKPIFLRQDDLIAFIMERPVKNMEGLLTYEEWLKIQFYDVEKKSIWAC